jgi:heat shock protein HtpX
VYEQIARNKWRSIFLVLGVLVLAAGIGYLFGYFFQAGPVGLVLALGIAAVGSWSSYMYGDKLVLRVSRARPASREEYPKLHNIVEGLCIAAGMPAPAIYVIPEEAPNAFATGRNPEHASIAVTEGLLEALNRVELEGVISHELSHVKNRDILVGTLTATLVGVVVLLAGWMRWGLFWGGGRGRDRGGGGGGNPIILIIALVAMILAPLAAQLIRFAVSRRREYLADADGALLTRYPPGLASALRKIAGAPNTMRAANDATAHLWFSQPSRAVGEGHSRVERLFSTHPPIEERIKALQEM